LGDRVIGDVNRQMVDRPIADLAIADSSGLFPARKTAAEPDGPDRELHRSIAKLVRSHGWASTHQPCRKPVR
jgi:hypothetical protein